MIEEEEENPFNIAKKVVIPFNKFFKREAREELAPEEIEEIKRKIRGEKD